MKNLIRLTYVLIAALLFTSCEKLEEEKPVYNGPAQVEIDAAVLNAALSGRTYPMLTRIPGYGRPALSTATTFTDVTPNITVPADPLLTRTSGTVKFRVNLVTAQRSAAEVIKYRVMDTETIGGTATTVTTAQSGVHYTTSGQFTLPANSSFGEIEVVILNPGVTTGTRDLVIELLGNDNIKPSPNYSKLGIRIAQN
ncbi:hypothetical protein [Hufsiella ginkgonis]|uniref:DUF4843 domain-containing protein n=1 Tax=Hufsiella ginkgonis TaxID=2695274 RepID=A0A7K1Y1C4_9SPHI|nr:hypothetical protein [Hufsiella ginkgonis]MXV17031.1 hypothetical protein [Hufsiella ginkgonis]